MKTCDLPLRTASVPIAVEQLKSKRASSDASDSVEKSGEPPGTARNATARLHRRATVIGEFAEAIDDN